MYDISILVSVHANFIGSIYEILLVFWYDTWKGDLGSIPIQD